MKNLQQSQLSSSSSKVSDPESGDELSSNVASVDSESSLSQLIEDDPVAECSSTEPVVTISDPLAAVKTDLREQIASLETQRADLLSELHKNRHLGFQQTVDEVLGSAIAERGGSNPNALLRYIRNTFHFTTSGQGKVLASLDGRDVPVEELINHVKDEIPEFFRSKDTGATPNNPSRTQDFKSKLLDELGSL